MSNGQNQTELGELSRHYDSMLWTVTSLWAAAVGGLLLYSGEHFDAWVALFGLGLTVSAMYFAYSFRLLRRRVHNAMAPELRQLFLHGPGLRQWDVFTLVFLGLVILWGRLLIQNSRRWWPVWLLAAVLAAAVVGAMWGRERWAPKADA